MWAASTSRLMMDDDYEGRVYRFAAQAIANERQRLLGAVRSSVNSVLACGLESPDGLRCDVPIVRDLCVALEASLEHHLLPAIFSLSMPSLWQALTQMKNVRRRVNTRQLSTEGSDDAHLAAEAVALAKQNAAAGKRPRGFETSAGGGAETGGGADDGPKPKTLVELHQEQQASEKAAKKGKADWEGQHPWKPWNRDTDLDVRKANPKGKESILNNQHMGKLGDRFGGGRRESTFM